MLLASLSYALGATYAKQSFSGIPPLGMAIGQLTAATALLLPLSVASVPERAPSLVVALSMLGLALLSTAVAYLIYFRLIENVGPDKHTHRHAARARLRAPVRRPAPRRALRIGHAGRARHHPLERRPHHRDLFQRASLNKATASRRPEVAARRYRFSAGRGSSACIGRGLWACRPPRRRLSRPTPASCGHRGRASLRTRSHPPRLVPTKLLFSSMVVKLSAPSGRFTKVP